MKKFIAVYVRVSSKKQNMRSQQPDLERWADAQDLPIRWYKDTYTGKSMQRPAWSRLEKDIRDGHVHTVCVWRIDRLGRTAKGLTALFEELRTRKVNLVSLKDGLDLYIPPGRLMANVLASISQFETELRGERVLAGQAAARAAGKRWGGSKKGVAKKVTSAHIKTIKSLLKEGMPITSISKSVGLSRQTIYTLLASRPDNEA